MDIRARQDCEYQLTARHHSKDGSVTREVQITETDHSSLKPDIEAILDDARNARALNYAGSPIRLTLDIAFPDKD